MHGACSYVVCSMGPQLTIIIILYTNGLNHTTAPELIPSSIASYLLPAPVHAGALPSVLLPMGVAKQIPTLAPILSFRNILDQIIHKF